MTTPLARPARSGGRVLAAAIASPAVLAAVAVLGYGATSTGGTAAGAGSGCTAPVGGVVLAGATATRPAGVSLGSEPGLFKTPTSVGIFRGEQLTNAGEIIAAGQSLGVDTHGVTVAVMTAIGESTLRNVDFGDKAGPDSRGLFQQRGNGAWGTYTDRMTPRIAATNFYKALLAVPGWRSLPPTIAAHQTQHNADPFHYQPWWAAAVQVVAALTANPTLANSLQAGGDDAPCQQAEVNPAALVGASTGTKAYNAALSQAGTPYSWGGGGPTGPSRGIAQGAGTIGYDCSALAQYAYYQATGKTLPRTARAQRAALPAVPLTQLQAGDLIFFHDASHMAISDGAGGFVHAPRTGKTVEHVANWATNTYWSTGVDGAARPRL